MRISDWSSDVCSSDLLRRKLGTGDEADRRFVRVLSAVLDHGVDAVEAAVREALLAGVTSDDIIFNILSSHREPPRPLAIATPEDLLLRHPPRADCHRYDRLRGLHARSEEHTSELQSLMRISHDVFSLKKNISNNDTTH